MALLLGKCLLRFRRKERNISQEELSRLLEVLLGVQLSPSRISQLENNTGVLTPLQMKAIALVLNLDDPLHDLYGFEGIPPRYRS